MVNNNSKTDLYSPSILSLLQEFKGKRVLVIGDVMLDEYIWTTTERISPEAPVPVAKVERITYSLGGAANVAANISALGGIPILIGVIGADQKGRKLINLLKQMKMDYRFLVSDKKRVTTQKTRIIAHNQHIVRIDNEDTNPVIGKPLRLCLRNLQTLINGVDSIVISDYKKGLINKELSSFLFSLSHKLKIPVIVDPKGTDYTIYRIPFIITPNISEAEKATGIKIEDYETLKKAADKIRDMTGAVWVIITMGKDGMMIIDKKGEMVHLPAIVTEVCDITGAGDTVVASLGLAIASGIECVSAGKIATWAAGVVVRKVGTAVATPQEIELAIKYHNKEGVSRKIKSRDQIVTIVDSLKKEGKKIVFTNGVFDILHIGHITYLQEAKKLGDILIVGINSDHSVKTIKGGNRPIIPVQQRAQILASLEFVDYVIIFDESTPIKTIKLIKPDIHVKGGDYQRKEIPEAGVVKSYGGKIVIASRVANASTTAIINKIKNSPK